MIIYFYGNRGCGKTLSSVILTDLFNKLYNAEKKKCIIFTNVEMDLKDHEIFDFFNPEFQNTKQPKIFLFDEMDKYSDSRNSMSSLNKFIGYSVSLSRKTNTDYIFTTQFFNSLDKRLRVFADFIILPTKSKNKIEWEIYNQNNGNLKTITLNLDISKYYKRYDSYYLTLDKIQKDLPKLKELVKKFNLK